MSSTPSDRTSKLKRRFPPLELQMPWCVYAVAHSDGSPEAKLRRAEEAMRGHRRRQGTTRSPTTPNPPARLRRSTLCDKNAVGSRSHLFRGRGPASADDIRRRIRSSLSTPVRKCGDGCGRGSRGELAKRGGGDAVASSTTNDNEIARDPRAPEGLRASSQVPGASQQGGPLGFRGPSVASKRPQHTLLYLWIGVLTFSE